jgi:hypothetical protein
VQVEEQKRRAEADKLAALTALENASVEFMREKQEKKELEAKIAAMQVRLCLSHQTQTGLFLAGRTIIASWRARWQQTR